YELFIPVGSDESKKSKEIQVVLATRNPEFIATCTEMQNLHSDAEAEAWLLKNHDRLFPRVDVRGLASFGIDMKETERKKLMDLDSDIVKDFTMIDDGSKPNLKSGLTFCGVGLLSIGAGFLYWRSKREET